MGGFEARDSATKLGTLLADITGGLSAAEIHAAVVTRLQQPEEDARLASLMADEAEFATMWTALAQGEPLPAAAWETVILPAVVAFSDRQALKTNLERVTSLWLTAGEGAQTVQLPLEPVDGQVLSVASDHIEFAASDLRVGPGPVPTLFPTIDVAERASKQRWPRSLVALALVALFVVGGFWWMGGKPVATGQPTIDSVGGTLRPSSAQSDSATTEGPSVLPTPGAGTAPEDPAAPSTLPPPPPTWAGPGPAVAPSAPTGLTVKGITSTTVALAWQVPANPGSGAISYYRVFRDGNDSGWTDHTSATIKQLAPGIGYAFHVVAYNTAGVVSAASEVVSATTATAPAPTTAPPTGRPPMLRILPQAAIRLGDSFSVSGRGWPCGSPAEVRIFIAGQAVAVAVLDSEGAFNAAIAVDSDEPAVPHIHALVSGVAIPLAIGQYTVTAELASQASCAFATTQSTQVNFRA